MNLARTPIQRSTPLKPGEPPKRKSPLNRVSKKNSKPGKDVPTRRSVAALANGRCELCTAPGDEPHHIFGGKGRFDLPGNLINLCGQCHRFGKNSPTNDPIGAAIRCMHAKWRRGQFIPEHIGMALGFDPNRTTGGARCLAWLDDAEHIGHAIEKGIDWMLLDLQDYFALRDALFDATWQDSDDPLVVVDLDESEADFNVPPTVWYGRGHADLVKRDGLVLTFEVQSR